MTSRAVTKKNPTAVTFLAPAATGMEVAIRGPGEKKAYCATCEAAGCPDCQGVPGMSQECRAPGAYVGDDVG